MTTATAENLALEIRRTFAAPPERVFAAWTEPEYVRQWFGPAGANAQDVQMDLRVGGRYSISVAGCEGGACVTAVGEFIEITPPSRLVYSWAWADDEDWDGIDSIIIVEFNKVPEGTELVLTHKRFPSDESRNNHNHGWSGSFDKLATLLAS